MSEASEALAGLELEVSPAGSDQSAAGPSRRSGKSVRRPARDIVWQLAEPPEKVLGETACGLTARGLLGRRGLSPASAVKLERVTTSNTQVLQEPYSVFECLSREGSCYSARSVTASLHVYLELPTLQFVEGEEDDLRALRVPIRRNLLSHTCSQDFNLNKQAFSRNSYSHY